ncbi:exonuclease domain-containing protein [Faecalibacter rhinopitheci]|uniref:DNA polymerase III subunit epsilon n=1 Tax=Faecalibacter rhinopitheci TaxID=2779678 RepID=A0A8J7KHN9_9FLAO|nr:exonuclease domain-containing protein [Faecalibacter rhinopitheci]MBF0596541.1 DNA polymerase III subunit epsilon [Faecalibacter rhinopitheci]
MYAILDIEATGGKVGEESIIEIAIYKYDGENIVDQFISLVNPQSRIDPFVQKLTKITEKMVKTAPKFHEIAKRIVDITDGCTLVGHNVTFDYRMLIQEFNRLGYQYEKDWIDTFEYAETLIPGMPSYSLGKLCTSLGIIVTNRHRASGDALATVALFKMLLDKDNNKIITKKSGLKYPKKANSKYDKLLAGLPNKPGLFYLYNEEKEIIYIGKSINIAQTVGKIFTSKTLRNNNIKRYTKSIKVELTGSNLLASVKEINEINRIKPTFNPGVYKRSLYQHNIYFRENKHTLSKFEVGKNRKSTPFLSFQTKQEADKALENIITDYHLCQQVNQGIKSDESCFGYTVGTCNGICIGKESIQDYNKRIKEIAVKTKFPANNFLIVSRGRKGIEKSFICIENNEFIGYGYYEFHHQIKSMDLIKKIITKAEETKDIKSIIRNYLFKAKEKQIIKIK